MPTGWAAGKGDHECFRKLTEGLTDRERECVRQNAHVQEWEILSQHVELLNAVADALERDGELDQAAFEAIVEKYRAFGDS